MKNLRIVSILFLALILGAGFFQCSTKESEDAQGVEVQAGTSDGAYINVSTQQFETMKMQWGNPEMQEFSAGIPAQGTVKVPVEGIQEISAFFGGYVSGLKLLEGESVSKGQVLFYLENPDFVTLQQEFLEANSQLNYLREEFERQQTLFAEKISSQKNYLKAEADYQSTKAKAESLRKQLSLIHINASELKAENIRSKVPVLAPISGFVEAIHLVQGSFLPAGGKAMTLISKEHLHIELVVFEKNATQIHKGQKVQVSIPDLPGKKLVAEVFMVGQSINAERQINIHAHLPEEKEEEMLVPGMFIEAVFQTDPQQAWVLPSTAIINSEGTGYVLVRREQSDAGFQLEKVAVQTGKTNNEGVEIMPNDAISASTVVLTKGGFNLLP
ncbi:efflux RND transporter periplasmic adaptor subunit [Algoriphagus halophytocola]|uniref:efflux RND transporter periplasmic adaptor subunit n=1 Tax=Algoriphagus halophytocola TaxID=2991499 RepID=UPI0022DDB65B|nr:efflux RND transporter periplasmic adaptor subunit [Algoriphagus sp. TR-M9]WBL41566.1 efflux RND transporter periplasmic adaptor subunit [Algoriphagus sp. TR-M9]